MKEMVSGPLANVFVAWRIEKKSKCSLSPSELLFIMFPSKRYQDSLLQDYIYLKQVSQRDWKKTKVVFLTEQLQTRWCVSESSKMTHAGPDHPSQAEMNDVVFR